MSMPGVMGQIGARRNQPVIGDHPRTGPLRQFRAELGPPPGAAPRHPRLESEAELLTNPQSWTPPRRRLVFPDTYWVLRGSSDILVLPGGANMRRELERAWAERRPTWPPHRYEKRWIMASLIEKKPANRRPADDRRVFINRLKLGMRPQNRPSVIYGLGEKHLTATSPAPICKPTPIQHSTPRRPSLPSPIAPARAALYAALHPADGARCILSPEAMAARNSPSPGRTQPRSAPLYSGQKDWNTMACFITLEGIDGAGKTSHLPAIAALLTEHGIDA